ncbi:hypothetical protein R1flu_011029 [Riccia fluitans]|uniref:Uncharacterized protein n=1 Tax=Riccia fluitans TaxID=41844 RepID=A0ABD1ZAU4_9MARC
MAAGAGACCANLRGFSGREGDRRFFGLAHFLVPVTPNSKRIQDPRGAFQARYFTVKLCKSGGGKIPLFRSNFAVQSQKYRSFCSRRDFFKGFGNDDKVGRRFLVPLAAVATGDGDWRTRWEDSDESQVDSSGTWSLNFQKSEDRLVLFGIFALTGLAVIRLVRGSSLLSLSAIILFLCLCGFHQLKPRLYFLGEKVEHLKRSFIRNVRLMPIGSKQQPTSVDSPQVDMLGFWKSFDRFTSIIRSLDREMRSNDSLSGNDLISLQSGITHIRENMYRAASALHAEESLIQLKLQNNVGFGERKGAVTAVHYTPGSQTASNHGFPLDKSPGRELETASDMSGFVGVDMKLVEEVGDLSSVIDSQQEPQSSSSYNFGGQKIPGTSVNYQVITAGLELKPVCSFTPVVLKSQAAVGIVSTHAPGDSLSSKIAAVETNSKQDEAGVVIEDFKVSSLVPLQIIYEPVIAVDIPRHDSIDVKTGLNESRREQLIENESSRSLEVGSISSVHQEVADGQTLAYTDDSKKMIVSVKSSTDPWHDDESRLSDASSSVMEDGITPSHSVRRWGSGDTDNDPSVSSVGVAYRNAGGRGRGNSQPSVDLWGTKATPTAGRPERGTLIRIKATRRGPLGSIDDLNNELPENPVGGWKEEQMRRDQMRKRDSGEQTREETSGQQYVSGEPELWNNGAVMDETVSRRRSVGSFQNYRDRDRDLDAERVSGRDREWSYGGKGSQNRKMREEVEEDYGKDRRRANGYNNLQEGKRSYNTKEDAQMLNEEEEEGFLRKREARDMRDDENESWDGDDVGTSWSGMDRRRSIMRRTSNPRVPLDSRSPMQRVDDNEDDEDYVDEDYPYKKEIRNLEEEEQASGIRSRSRGETQYSGREMQKKPDYYPTSERGNTDPTRYLQNEMETEERNLPVRQLGRMQLEKFDRLLDEGEALLEEGMQGLEGRIEVGVAERMLYEAANLFEGAADIDPSSVIAIGFWGNTLLVHGELKLRLSQQLRSMLPPPSSYSVMKSRGGRDRDDQRESMELTLQNVCEECEELLVDAGRKYRMALSLDRTDMRALYNWGLALCYRGQLIADEGGERAIQDADKVYLAAIDKFEAMLGISQEYAAGALYNWGLAMRDRARLRPMGDSDRVKLLLQAKELFQDSVRLDPNNGQARGAVTAAVTELQELKRFEEIQNEQESRGRSFRNWW